MSLAEAKALLDRGPGEPSTGYVSAADIQASYDALNKAYGINLYWDGTAGSGTWPDRPTVDAGVLVTWWSTLDKDAPPPDSIAGDVWLRAPGSEN